MFLKSSLIRVSRLVCIALVLVSSCGTVVLATPAKDAYKQGKDLLDKKDYKEAILALSKQAGPKQALSSLASAPKNIAAISAQSYQADRGCKKCG